MAKMIVIYQTPKDIESFEQHYFNVHIPLAKQLPGLIKYEINDGGIVSTMGHNDVFRIATLYFETMDSIKTAFASEIGQKCAADRKVLAPDNETVQIYLCDTKEV
ncbi:MAG: hypothetical protein JWM46_113 [Candidatus Kaiserbacteria bacterium]|nr:hypothetical protein [Candidatus Kaiserbacteria bacterium]